MRILGTTAFVFALFANTALAANLDSDLNEVRRLDKEGHKVEALQALKSALNGYSETIPIQVVETRFVVAKAPGFRNYTEHSTVYRVKEQVNMYFEPVGIRWKNIGKGLVGVNLNTDVRIETADGSFKLERKNVGLINATAKSPSNDFFMNFFIDSRGYPAGTYVVEITLHDIFKMQQTSFTRQFTLK